MPEPQEQPVAPQIPKWKALLSLRWVGSLRSRMSLRRLMLPLLGLGLIAAGAVGYLAIFGEEKFDPDKLQQAKDAIEVGDMPLARQLALELYAFTSLTAEQRAELEFLLGKSLAFSAEGSIGEDRIGYAEEAIGYLRDAGDAGVAAEYETELKFLLGYCYMETGAIERAIEMLESIENRPDAPRPSTDLMLADAWLQATQPSAETSLAYNDRALEAADESGRDAVILQRAEILLKLGRTGEARQFIAPLTARRDPSHAQFLLGQVALAEGRRLRQSSDPEQQALANEMFREALRLFEIAEGRDTLRRQRIAGSNYLRAQCLLELQEPEYALVELDEIERRDPRSAEGIAAGILQARVLQSQGRAQQAVDKWRTVLDMANAQDPFRNPWITRAEIAQQLRDAVRAFWTEGDFEEASILLRSDLHFVPREESEQLLAQTYEQSGAALMQQAATQDDATAAQTMLDARIEYQRAGHVLTRLARLRAATRQYPDDLWASAQAYLAADDAENAIRVLDQYVLHDSTNERKAEALYYLAKSHLRLGDAATAQRIAEECIEQFPKNPVRYEARLVASQAGVELDELEAAEEPLIDNLDRDLLTPDSTEWRQSLFELGKLLYLERKWDEAEVRLTEAVRRQPQDPRSLEARYLLAETLKQRAQQDRDRSTTSAVESQRVGAARSALGRLQDAVLLAEQTVNGLDQLATEEELGSADQALRRNAAFLRANLLAELSRFDESAQAYLKFINRYYGRPETLDAYLAVSTVFRRMDREAEARTAIAQAYETLQTLPADAALAHTSAGTKAQWQTLLTWLQDR